MLPKTLHLLVWLVFPAVLLTCERTDGPISGDSQPPVPVSTDLDMSTPVEVAQVKRGVYSDERIVSGRLRAALRAPLSFSLSGTIDRLSVREGQTVNRDSFLASLDDHLLRLQLSQMELELDKAIVQKKDLLLANGGEAEDDGSVSPEKLELIHVLSGFNQARHNLQRTEESLYRSDLRAPFDGIVADVQVVPYQYVSAGQIICTLIGRQKFEITFYLMETELPMARIGQPVKWRLLNGDRRIFSARIHTINPRVGEEGLVRLTALVSPDRNKGLMDGMNVELILPNPVSGQLLIPASAVVLRSGRPVVFVFDSTNKRALWHQIHILHQNDETAAVQGKLEEGELVIAKGNLLLDHNAPVHLIDK
ncbi:MAG: efflux RND transporter periplasmic adaptor subunit [Saprospiraceae bacterium]|nr:efflux RND transporter periplasmic adaptor subunit [Saprospiraceae bacterium]